MQRTQKTSHGLFDQWYGTKRYFPMRMFKGTCPLTLNERVMWSFLVDKIAVGGATMADVAGATGLEQGRTVPSIKKELIGKHLADVAGNKLIALPPDPEWAVSRADDGKTPWHKRLMYFPMCWRPSCWTVSQTVLYFCLLSPNVQRGKKILPTQKKAGLAAMLGMSHDTVERAFVLYEEQGLVEYDYLKKPSQEILSHFTDQPKKTTPASGPWLASIACEWPFGDLDQGPWMAGAVDRYSEKLLKARYTPDDVLKYWSDVYHHANQISARGSELLLTFFHNWPPLFNRVETESERNRKEGKFRGANSLGLLTRESKSSLGRQVASLTFKVG